MKQGYSGGREGVQVVYNHTLETPQGLPSSPFPLSAPHTNFPVLKKGKGQCLGSLLA